MRSCSGTINIAASAQKLDVNNQISLQFYYRIADNILKQADIFRREKNIIDLYIMLLRFSSLASETIPCHRDYKAALQSDKNFIKKKLLNALRELEDLKPEVWQKIYELNRRRTYQINGRTHHHQNSSLDSSLEWPPPQRQNLISSSTLKTPRPNAQEFVYQGPNTRQFSHGNPVEKQFRQFSLSMPRPKEETLSRHSILGPNGLHGQWQAPRGDKGVQYPRNIDFTPVEIPRENSMQQPVEDGALVCCSAAPEISSLETVSLSDNVNQARNAEELDSLISFETTETPLPTEIIRQPSPPPVLADVQDLIPAISPPITEAECGIENSPPDGLVCSDPLQLHISSALMDSFMKLAKANTVKNLETCGVLAGSLESRKFYVTTLIIPKQESTSDSCQTTNEEEIFVVQDKQFLLPLGWIHTHPTQSCFMSSIDLHTHYSYQIMLPEAVAIVMAPRDSSRTHGIFRLTSPGGMTVIGQCPRRGFHPHERPDGSPLYKQCTDVYLNSYLKFDIIDLR